MVGVVLFTERNDLGEVSVPIFVNRSRECILLVVVIQNKFQICTTIVITIIHICLMYVSCISFVHVHVWNISVSRWCRRCGRGWRSRTNCVCSGAYEFADGLWVWVFSGSGICGRDLVGRRVGFNLYGERNKDDGVQFSLCSLRNFSFCVLSYMSLFSVQRSVTSS